MRALRIALVALLLPVGARAETWREVKTEHFTIIGNARKGKLKRLAQDLETIRFVFQRGMDIDIDPAVPVRVFAVRNDKELRALMPSLGNRRAAGAFRNSGTSKDIVLRLDLPSEAGKVAYHEYHHVLVDRTMPYLPLWLREGVAELWENARLDRRTAMVGRAETLGIHHARRTDMVLLPVRQLIAVGSHSAEYREREHAGNFYLQSTILTHMLLLQEEDGERKMSRFLALLGQGTPQTEALEATYGTPEELDRRLNEYIWGKNFRYLRKKFDERPPRAEYTMRKLREPEVLGLRGAFLARGGNTADALPLLRDALRLDPEQPDALSGMARLSPPAEAVPLLERAAALRPAFDVHWALANALVSTSAGEPAIAHHLERTIELNPGFAPAYVRLAEVRAANDAPKAFELMATAARLDEARPTYLVRAARILDQQGAADEAERVAAEAARRAVRMPQHTISADVCLRGAAAGFAAAVMPACDRAVGIAPHASPTRSARALARMALDDLEGAIEDLEYVARDARIRNRPEEVEQHVDMIELLKSGRNPLPPGALDELDASLARSFADLE